MLQGAKICLFQCSYEAPAIFSILQLVLGTQSSLEQLKQASGGTSRSLIPKLIMMMILDGDVRAPCLAVEDGAWQDFLTFAAAFYANMGNFKSFGDIKIVPGCSAEAFWAVVQVCPLVLEEGPCVGLEVSRISAGLHSEAPLLHEGTSDSLAADV